MESVRRERTEEKRCGFVGALSKHTGEGGKDNTRTAPARHSYSHFEKNREMNVAEMNPLFSHGPPQSARPPAGNVPVEKQPPGWGRPRAEKDAGMGGDETIHRGTEKVKSSEQVHA